MSDLVLIGFRRFAALVGCIYLSLNQCATAQTRHDLIDTQDSFTAQINTDITQFMGTAKSPLTINIQPIKSDQDTRKYRYFLLPNQLRVLLISDVDAESSAAALNVSVGANQNPTNRLGLAHFLEHMLLLGTEKYPESGEYQQYIAQQGGFHNASTSAENTQFYFTVKHQAFEPALDRFSQFFIAPLFNEIYVERERHAVNAEFSAKLLDDARREWDVYRQLMNPQHPGSAFAVGNFDTLKNDQSLRVDLINFYNRYYSPENMTLVMLSNQPLSKMQKWVEQKFSAVPKRDVQLSTEPYPPLFEKDFLPATIEIKPEKEIRQLVFSFPVPQSTHLLINKPYDYIAHLLGHENKGSFFDILKSLGWAEKVNAGIAYPSRDDALFQIRITLTPTGVRAHKQIVSLLFFVIQEIKTSGIEAWRYQELQSLGQNEFQYDEKKSPAETVTKLAQNMQDYAVPDILRGQSTYANFDKKQLLDCFSYLTAENILVVLTDPNVQAWRLTNIYSVPFSVKRGIADILPIKQGTRQDFTLPAANPFIPEKLFVKSASLLNPNRALKTIPELLVEKPHTQIWYQQDHQFNRPQSAINLHLVIPPEKITAERTALNYIYASIIREQLNDSIYYASLSGLEFAIEPHARGIDVSVFGFSNRQSLLLNYAIVALAKPNVTENKFTRIKMELIRNWDNQQKNLPYQVMMSQLPSILMSPQWSAGELSHALKDVDYQQFVQFAKQFLWDAKIEGLVYGNFLPPEAIKLSAIIEHGLQSRQTGRKVSDSLLTLMSKTQTKPWLFTHKLEHQDKVVALYIQSLSDADVDTASMLLIRQILQPVFFHQLRTEKQMGYVVANIAFPLKQIEGSVFLVQSPNFSEADIVQAIDVFLDQNIVLLENDFAAQKDSLIQQLQESPRSIREQNQRHWESILQEDYRFDRRQRIIVALHNLTREDLRRYYQQVFLNKNRRIWMMGSDLDKTEEFNLLLSKSAFRQAAGI